LSCSCQHRRATEHQKRESSVFDTRDKRSAGGHKDQHCPGLRIPILKLPARVKTLLNPMNADTWGQEMVWEWAGSAPNTGYVQILTASGWIRKVYRVHGLFDRSRSGSSRQRHRHVKVDSGGVVNGGYSILHGLWKELESRGRHNITQTARPPGLRPWRQRGARRCTSCGSGWMVASLDRKRLGSTARTSHRTLPEAFPIKPSDKPEGTQKRASRNLIGL
jgi:hypothetical protein